MLADSVPVGKQRESNDTAIGNSLGRGLYFCCSFHFQHTLHCPFTILVLQAWHWLDTVPPYHLELGWLSSSSSQPAAQTSPPTTPCPASPDTSWIPGLSWFLHFPFLTGLPHRQFLLLWPGFAFAISIRMGSALQGSGSFYYMEKGGGEGCFYFGSWGVATRKGLCNLGRRPHVANEQVVEKMKVMDTGRETTLPTLILYSASPPLTDFQLSKCLSETPPPTSTYTPLSGAQFFPPSCLLLPRPGLHHADLQISQMNT